MRKWIWLSIGLLAALLLAACAGAGTAEKATVPPATEGVASPTEGALPSPTPAKVAASPTEAATEVAPTEAATEVAPTEAATEVAPTEPAVSATSLPLGTGQDACRRFQGVQVPPASTEPPPWQIPEVSEEDWVRGAKNPVLTVVEYSDFQ